MTVITFTLVPLEELHVLFLSDNICNSNNTCETKNSEGKNTDTQEFAKGFFAVLLKKQHSKKALGIFICSLVLSFVVLCDLFDMTSIHS